MTATEMSMTYKINRKKAHVTPKGFALWTKVYEPDTKYDNDGKYSIKLRLTEEAKDQLKAKVDAEMALWMADQDKKVSRIPDEPQFVEEFTKDTDEPTGFWLVNFSMKAIIRNKDGSVMFEQKPMVVDSKGTNITKQLVQIGNGSEIKVSFSMVPYALKTKGVSLGLKGVQILNLVEYTDEGDLGFGEEDGYQADPDQEAAEAGFSNEGDGYEVEAPAEDNGL